jgi:hypothetical protein
MNRRGFLRAAASFLAAPAIVRVGSIMPVKAFVEPYTLSEAILASGTFEGPFTVEMVREAMRRIRELEPNPLYRLSTHPAAARHHGTPAG